MGAADFRFDKDAHAYFINGVRVPGVTSILDDVIVDLSRIPAETLELARARGTAVHTACELYDRGTLDYATVQPELWPYLQAWTKFIHQTKFKAELIEQQVYSLRYSIAGTLDRFGWFAGGKAALIDIKTSELISHSPGVQLAAYKLMATERELICREWKTKRYTVNLYDDGKYELTEYKDLQDEAVFLAALQIFHYRQRRKKQ